MPKKDKGKIDQCVENFKKKVDLALKGKTVGQDIVSAVWEFLKELDVKAGYPDKKYGWKAEKQEDAA